MRRDILNWKHYHGDSITAPFLELFKNGPVSDEEFAFLINNSSENVARHVDSHYNPIRKCLNSIYYTTKYTERDLSDIDRSFINGKKVNFIGFLERISKYPMSKSTFDAILENINTTKDFEPTTQNKIKISDEIRMIANKLHNKEKYQGSVTSTKIYSKDKINYDLEKQISKSQNDKPSERKARLQDAPNKPEKIQITSVGYRRNPDVIIEALLRANGVCELCNQKAPFFRKKDHTPYLEVHHKIMLSDGGEDTLENAIALCPNCHREQHFGL